MISRPSLPAPWRPWPTRFPTPSCARCMILAHLIWPCGMPTSRLTWARVGFTYPGLSPKPTSTDGCWRPPATSSPALALVSILSHTRSGWAWSTHGSTTGQMMADAILGALWGNQADLSLWPAGEGVGPGGAHLLADDTAAATALIAGLASEGARADIILDNAGAELVHDLALADALLTAGLRVVLHAKSHPTFVSDALIADVRLTIDWFAGLTSPAATIGARLGVALDTGHLELRDGWYWTSSLLGWELPDILRADLACSGLLISKGDANYRRWLGDRHWPYDTPLSHVLAYLPAPMLLLRTCKSNVAAGLDPARITDAAARDPQWITGGRWGVIQLYTR